MRNILAVIFSALVAGCTSSVAMLQTDKPESNEYRFIFGKMLLDYDKAKTLSHEPRIANYESQLNFVLQKDSNTKSCSIVPGSINFGEPGSQGEARVRCTNVVSFQIQKGVYNREGSPFYVYTLPQSGN